MSSTASNKNIMYWVKAAIFLWFLFGFGQLEPFGSLEKVGMQVLGIFIGLLFGWTFIGFIWPSLLGVLAIGLSEYTNVSGALATGFGNVQVAILVLFVLIFAAYLERVGVSQVIANWFISRKFTIGKPWLFSFMILLVAYIIGATISLTVGILLIWSIFYGICDVVGYKKGEKYPTVMVVAIVFATFLGFAVFPFKPVAAITLGSLESISGMSVSFLTFSIANIVISMASLIFFMIIFRFIIRPDVSPLETDADHFAHLRNQKITKVQKVGFFFLIFYLILMFAPSFIPETTMIGAILKNLGTTGCTVLVVVLAVFWPTNGEPSLNMKEAAHGISWDIFFMLVSTMPVSAAMSNPEVGVMTYMVELLQPIFHGMNPFVFAIVFAIVAGIITQFAHNLVLVAVLVPVAYSLSVALEFNPIITVFMFTYCIQIAIASPGSSAQGALIFVNKDWVDTASAYKYSWIMVLCSLTCLVVIGTPLAMVLFGM